MLKTFLIKNKSPLFFFLIIFFFSWGVFLRFYKLQDPSPWLDEGFSVVDANNFLYLKKFSLLSGAPRSNYLYATLSAPFLSFFGKDIYWYRFIPALFGALFPLLIFFIVLDLSRRRLPALFACVYASFAYYEIAWSREARAYTLLQFFLFLSFYFLLKNKISSKKILFLLLAFISFLLAFLSQPLALLALPAILYLTLCDVPFAFYKNILLGKNKKYFFLGLGILITVFFGVFLPFLQDLSLVFLLPLSISFLIANYFITILLSTFYFSIPSENPQEKKYALAFLILLLASIILSLLFPSFHYRYLFVFTPSLIILSSLFLSRFASFYKRFFSVSLLIILVAFFTKEIIFFPQSKYPLESDAWSTIWTRSMQLVTPKPDFATAYAFIKEKKQPHDRIISAYPMFSQYYLNDPGFWLKFDYLGTVHGQGDVYIDKTTGKEAYVGAEVIHSAAGLLEIISAFSGFIVYDEFSRRNRLSPALLEFIETNLPKVFEKSDNELDRIYVYRFPR
ncbi:MAG: phospholipid carrier-dependent glycosyltransferase [Candidatus Harrisonbacteria bacterium]|nr:phospholipid carrier-dependent glycosyltransferase [Candidatus Harrisonbacteria bacterium]